MDTGAKYSFHDSEGAHPAIIEALARTNLSQQSGYGNDEYSEEARNAIRNLIGADEAMIYFTPGGTGHRSEPLIHSKPSSSARSYHCD
ncbi:hypothetical protein XPA_001302 [Xanthoria parietina]